MAQFAGAYRKCSVTPLGAEPKKCLAAFGRAFNQASRRTNIRIAMTLTKLITVRFEGFCMIRNLQQSILRAAAEKPLIIPDQRS